MAYHGALCLPALLRLGDEGDLFYVVESGTLDVWVKAPGTAHPVKVRYYHYYY